MKIKYFYNLNFFKADNEDVFDLGVFSCLKNAEKKKKQAAIKCGFVDNPENFRINRIGVKFEDNAEVEKSKTVLCGRHMKKRVNDAVWKKIKSPSVRFPAFPHLCCMVCGTQESFFHRK